MKVFGWIAFSLSSLLGMCLGGHTNPAAQTPACGDLAAYTEKWQRLLSLRDWEVEVSCAEIPDWQEAAALSYPDPWRKEVKIIIDPRAHESELLVAHELVHAVLSQVLESKSEVVEENVVVKLSELLVRLEGNQK